MTKREFRKRAQEGLQAANPDAALNISWTYGPQEVTWADGTAGLSGVLSVSAAGYKPRTMVATLLDGRVSVR